jgi:N-acetylglucosamine-6-phosphate deacetylase
MTMTGRHILRGARVVTPDAVWDPGHVVVENDRIAQVGAGEGPSDGETRDLDGRWLIPGLVDVHVHGGAGGDFTSPDHEEHARAILYHARNGTTSLLATTVTASPEQLLAAVDGLAGSIAAPGPGARIMGIHLEGPFISEQRRGAQNPQWIRDPDVSELESLIAASNDTIRMITVAPERPGAAELISVAVERGIIAAAGHSDATYDQLVASVGWGVRHCIHTYNGMRGLHHRDPGLVGGLLDVDELTCELITDGHHVHPAAARLLHRVKGPDRLVLITDAIIAAGMPDGYYEFGRISIDVRGGRAQVHGADALAGSTLTMGAALRNGVEMLGVDVAEAVHMASTTPARVLGLEHEIGAIAEGLAADLVVLSNDLDVEATMVLGSWI